MVKALEGKLYEGRADKYMHVWFGKRNLMGGVIAVFRHLKSCHKKEGNNCFPLLQRVGHETMGLN